MCAILRWPGAQRLQRRGDGGEVQSALGRGLAQRVLAAAAEIEGVIAEDPGGARNVAGEAGDALIVDGHEASWQLHVRRSKTCDSFNLLKIRDKEEDVVKKTVMR